MPRWPPARPEADARTATNSNEKGAEPFQRCFTVERARLSGRWIIFLLDTTVVFFYNTRPVCKIPYQCLTTAEQDGQGGTCVNPMVILLVEDDVAVQFRIWKLLKTVGFSVLNADSAEAALEMSRHYPGSIDLLLSDVRLPRMDGLELCKNIAAERPETKVLMMSGDLRSRERVCMNRLPFLQKPFTLTVLWDAIAGLFPVMAASVQGSAQAHKSMCLEPASAVRT